MSKRQTEKTAQCGGSLFSKALTLARPLLKPVAKVLAAAGLRFGAEKMLKKIFRKGFGPQEMRLFRFTQLLTPEQKKAVDKFLVGKGSVRGGGIAQYGGFLGMPASIGVPLAIGLLKKVLGKGMQMRPQRGQGMHVRPGRGRGMHVGPSPVFGSWNEKNEIQRRATV